MTATDPQATGVGRQLRVAVRMQWAEMRWSPFLVTVCAVQPTVLILVLASQQRLDPTEFGHRTAGVVLAAVWASSVWSSASILRADRVYGTLGALLNARASPQLVLLGRVLAASLLSTVITIGVVALDMAALGRSIGTVGGPELAGGLTAAWVSAIGLGQCLASLFVATRFAPQLSGALLYPVFIVGGMLLPADELPMWVRAVGRLLSFSWSLDLIDNRHPVRAGLVVLGLTMSYFFLGNWMFERVATRARTSGTLDVM